MEAILCDIDKARYLSQYDLGCSAAPVDYLNVHMRVKMGNGNPTQRIQAELKIPKVLCFV